MTEKKSIARVLISLLGNIADMLVPPDGLLISIPITYFIILVHI